MELGRHLAELRSIRFATTACLALGLIAALLSTYRITLSPIGLNPRSLTMAAASTQILVDTPRSSVTDLRQDLFDITSLTNRSLLIGNVMASPPVVSYIAARAGIPPEVIRVATPRTPNSPRPIPAPGQENSARDLLRSTDQYRLSIEANPTVPVIRIYAQAPSAQAAAELANASVDGLRDYLTQTAVREQVGVEDQVRLEQLGRASGAVLNGGVRFELALLVFLAVFGGSAATAIFLARVRRGLREARRAAEIMRTSATGPDPDCELRELVGAPAQERSGDELSRSAAGSRR